MTRKHNANVIQDATLMLLRTCLCISYLRVREPRTFFHTISVASVGAANNLRLWGRRLLCHFENDIERLI